MKRDIIIYCKKRQKPKKNQKKSINKESRCSKWGFEFHYKLLFLFLFLTATLLVLLRPPVIKINNS